MERLTYWNEEYQCWSYRCPSGQAAIEWAKYEDTGLTPDEINQLKAENAALKARLDKAVELPCRVGSEIWTIENVFNGKSTVQMIGNRIVDEIKHNKFNKNTMISKEPFELHFYPSEIDKTVFLTKEEAQKKLDELKDLKWH